jgi:hypothetical protein
LFEHNLRGEIMRTAIIAAAMLLATTAFAAPKLLRPVSVQDGRWNALSAAGVQNVWRGNHHVTLVGFTQAGKTIVMVKSADLKKPALVSMEAVKGKYGREIKATALTSSATKELGLVTASKAFKTALQSGGLFKNVKGKIEYDGSSNKGYAYKFKVTPKAPVEVKAPYGTYTVSELVRMVNALGNGETAYPSKYTFKYGK